MLYKYCQYFCGKNLFEWPRLKSILRNPFGNTFQVLSRINLSKDKFVVVGTMKDIDIEYNRSSNENLMSRPKGTT